MAKIQRIFMFIATRSRLCSRRVVRARLVFFILSLLSFLHLSITNANASYSLFTSASSVQTGANITVTWTAPSGSSTKDWVGLYKTGDSNQNYIAMKWVYTNAVNTGSLTISGLTSAEYLFFRCVGQETELGSESFTVTTNYTSIGWAETTSGGASSNIGARGEFRILTATSDSSNPNNGTTGESASIYFALQEVVAVTGAVRHGVRQ